MDHSVVGVFSRLDIQNVALFASGCGLRVVNGYAAIILNTLVLALRQRSHLGQIVTHIVTITGLGVAPLGGLTSLRWRNSGCETPVFHLGVCHLGLEPLQ
jgi:hypothetical protein